MPVFRLYCIISMLNITSSKNCTKTISKLSYSVFIRISKTSWSSGAGMETGRVDRHRSGRPAGRVAGRVEILRPAGQAG